MSNIFLLGFMGSGKTFLGKQLAEMMNYEFIDLDEVIEKSEGSSISGIFSSKGEEYFREKESISLKSFSETRNAIIATGGGTPCFHDNMNWMNEHGITVYLNHSPEILFQRLKPEADHRPLLSGKSDEELLHFIQTKLQERNPFYSQSHLIVNANEIAAAALQEKITLLIKTF
ncbi:MAG TPA: shikimate kinase [Chitinophagales bacterium]|nr:shikimate kinase [Chitinophagales bacterium]